VTARTEDETRNFVIEAVVDDSVALERTEVWPETMYSMEGDASNDSRAVGWRVSRSLWEPARALFVHGVDTTRLESTVGGRCPMAGRRARVTPSCTSSRSTF
jgi:hypothetical protein